MSKDGWDGVQDGSPRGSPDHQTGVLLLPPSGHIQLCLTRSQPPNHTNVMNKLLDHEISFDPLYNDDHHHFLTKLLSVLVRFVKFSFALFTKAWVRCCLILWDQPAEHMSSLPVRLVGVAQIQIQIQCKCMYYNVYSWNATCKKVQNIEMQDQHVLIDTFSCYCTTTGLPGYCGA